MHRNRMYDTNVTHRDVACGKVADLRGGVSGDIRKQCNAALTSRCSLCATLPKILLSR